MSEISYLGARLEKDVIKMVEETAQEAEKKGFNNPIFFKVPKNLTYIVGEITK